MSNSITSDVRVRVIAALITAGILGAVAWLWSMFGTVTTTATWWVVGALISSSLAGSFVGALFYRAGRKRAEAEQREREFSSAMAAFNLVPLWGAVVRTPQFDNGWGVAMILLLQNSRRFPGLPILSIGFEAQMPGTTWHHGTSLVTPLVGRDVNGDAFFEFTLTTITQAHVDAMQSAAVGVNYRHAVLSNIVIQAGPATMRFSPRILPLYYQADPDKPLDIPQLAPDEKSAIPPPLKPAPVTRPDKPPGS